ncbi:VanZ family protein [Phycisphaerales bacterium AB-hyl4]|uniref:VanZ family protein n=1 Tax=Natronomicrosphaera hydrolytica TaxID=3242702 RepID=A0ABV4U8H6_9BACT
MSKPTNDEPSPWPPPGIGPWVLASMTLWSAVLLVKLYPFSFDSAGSGGEGLLSLSPRSGTTVLWQIAMFVPLGFVEAQLARRLLEGFSAATLMLVMLDAGLLSLVGETVQWWLPTRTSSVIDLAANMIGGVAGYLLCQHLNDWRNRG